MSNETPEKGDKVAWNWGGGTASGKVAETKTEGELVIESKGKHVKKNASPDNPAVHVARSGNDVVKRASELEVQEKASGSGDKKREHEPDDGEDAEKEEVKETKKQKTGKVPTKRQEAKAEEEKAEKEKPEPKKAAGKAAVKKDDKPAKRATDKKMEKKDEETNGDGVKKGRGRPKKGDDETVKEKKKKDKKLRSEDGIGSRTRSRGKA